MVNAKQQLKTTKRWMHAGYFCCVHECLNDRIDISYKIVNGDSAGEEAAKATIDDVKFKCLCKYQDTNLVWRTDEAEIPLLDCLNLYNDTCVNGNGYMGTTAEPMTTPEPTGMPELPEGNKCQQGVRCESDLDCGNVTKACGWEQTCYCDTTECVEGRVCLDDNYCGGLDLACQINMEYQTSPNGPMVRTIDDPESPLLIFNSTIPQNCVCDEGKREAYSVCKNRRDEPEDYTCSGLYHQQDELGHENLELGLLNKDGIPRLCTDRFHQYYTFMMYQCERTCLTRNGDLAECITPHMAADARDD